jgi:hypothetical protein
MITINHNNYVQLLQTVPPRPIKASLAVHDVIDRIVDADEITPSVFFKRYSHEN